MAAVLLPASRPGVEGVDLWCHEGVVISDDNSRNLLYFESGTMRGLFEVMDAWQKEHGKRLLSTQVQQDGGKLSCIADAVRADVRRLVDPAGSGSGAQATRDRALVAPHCCTGVRPQASVRLR